MATTTNKAINLTYSVKHYQCLQKWFELVQTIFKQPDKPSSSTAFYPYQYDTFAYEALRKVVASNVVTHADLAWVMNYHTHVSSDLRVKANWSEVKQQYFTRVNCHYVFSNSVPDYALDATLAYGYTLATRAIALGGTPEWLQSSCIVKQLPPPTVHHLPDGLTKDYPSNMFAYDTIYFWQKG